MSFRERVENLVERVVSAAQKLSPQQQGAIAAVVAGGLALLATKKKHWLKAQYETWCLQLASASSLDAWRGGPIEWVKFQFEAWNLLGLDVYRRVEEAELGKEFLKAGVPHVDTGGASSKKKKGSKMPPATPTVKDLVLIGGGHSHVFILKNFGMKPLPGVRVILITRDVETPYSGMLPGHIAGVYTREECHIDLGRIARFAGAAIIHAEANGIDFEKKQVLLNNGRPPVHFDIVSINLGSTPRSHNSFAATVPITPVKPIDSFSRRWEALLRRVVETYAPISIAVVGAGAGGVELTLSMQYRLRNELAAAGKDPSLVSFTLIGRNETVMPSHNALVQEEFHSILKSRGVEVVLNRAVTTVEGSELVLEDGTRMHIDEVIWCTQAGTQRWLTDTGLGLVDGFIKVNDFMQSTSHPCAFSAGDVAVMANHPRPRAGVFAVRAGPPLAANLRHALLGEPLEPYVPQSRFLGIIGTGDPTLAVASKGRMCMKGSWLWDLKDWIDRKWMASYSTALPDMGGDVDPSDLPLIAHTSKSALAALTHASMRCGGCGAKVGASVLSRVLKRLDLPADPEHVLVGLSSPDDCAIVRAPAGGKALVHTVDFFRSFVADPYVFGQIAANHSLSDCHAMCADADTALAIAVVPFAVEDKVEETLLQMMAGAVSVLKEAGCTLVGGHTCEGSELAMGFVINGSVDPDVALTKGNLRPGDKLILTKGLGTGTLLAADMRVKAKGMWVVNALKAMCVSNRNAAFTLRDVGRASSCTDVTGFGLLGHLVEMARASSVSINLDLDAIPVLPGALECVALGITSSLQPANIRLKRAIVNQVDAAFHSKYPLLFDPQTAGGLLAGVHPEAADECVRVLRESGYPDATIIGEVGTALPIDPEYVTVSQRV